MCLGLIMLEDCTTELSCFRKSIHAALFTLAIRACVKLFLLNIMFLILHIPLDELHKLKHGSVKYALTIESFCSTSYFSRLL